MENSNMEFERMENTDKIENNKPENAGIESNGYGAVYTPNPKETDMRRYKRCGFVPWIRKIPWRRAWQPTPVLLPGESHGQRSLEGYSPQGCKESNTTEAT